MRTLRARLALALALSLLTLAAFAFDTRSYAQTFSEGFESGTKTAYAQADVQLSTGSWNFNDALIGNLSTDRKVGTASARVRNVGDIQMNFNRPSAGTVSLQHAVFGTDGSSTWALYKSTDNGSTWAQVGATVTTSSTSLATVTFTVNSAAAIRFRVVKLTGGTNRINIDNVSITNYVAPTPTPTPTPTPGPTPTPTPPPSSSEHLTMGNPSNATADVNQPDNYLMDKPEYAVSYNRDNGRPNWVSWHLDPTWLGSTPRQDDFRNDTTLPAGWYQVQATDYTGSGFDRGHHCPSADRTVTVAANSATFLMTNMMPQAPDNNQGPWASMENYLRTLVTSGNELYIIMGGSGQGGTGSNGGITMTVAGGHVAVPAQVWKVVLVQPQGTNDVARVTTSTRLIAVIMPNTQGIRTDTWQQYRVSVDQVEQMTGYDFFSNVPASIQAVIEARVDNQ